MVAERRARLARVTDLVDSKRCIVKWKPMKRAWHAAACAGKNRKQVSAFNPLAMEKVVTGKCP